MATYGKVKKWKHPISLYALELTSQKKRKLKTRTDRPATFSLVQHWGNHNLYQFAESIVAQILRAIHS